MSFAHGANDVANSVGTFAASYYVYTHMELPTKDMTIAPWMLVIGATGIVLG
jgi:phosphate/sulfate permease